jgi:biotin transport system substrate-specific component
MVRADDPALSTTKGICMSSAAIAPTGQTLARPTLADRFIPRSAVNNALLIAGGAAVVGAFAQLQIPLWPVPITGQTLAVMLVGATLGAWRGASALALYLVAGLAGVPLFAGFASGIASVTKPDFGFIIGFVFAAALIGWLSERNWDKHPLLSLAGFLGASVVPFLFGLPYLGFALGSLGLPNDLNSVLVAGFYPFVLGGVIKWAIAAAILPLAWKAVRAVDAHSKR